MLTALLPFPKTDSTIHATARNGFSRTEKLVNEIRGTFSLDQELVEYCTGVRDWMNENLANIAPAGTAQGAEQTQKAGQRSG